MQAKMIDLSEWEEFGAGGVGKSYNNKTDDSIILKLNNEGWPEEKALAEYNFSKKVEEMGIECPHTYDYVTDGTRFGMTVQRIKGKKSFYRILSEDPSRSDELAKRFAEHALKLHSTSCDTQAFPSMKEQWREQITGCADIPDDLKAKVLALFDDFSDATTCLHGDFHSGNIITAEGRDYWIDLGQFSYGDPYFDFANLYYISHMLPDRFAEPMFHIGKDVHRPYEELIEKYYFDYEHKTPEEVEAIKAKILKATMIKVAWFIVDAPRSKVLMIPTLQKYFGMKAQSPLILVWKDLKYKIFHKEEKIRR